MERYYIHIDSPVGPLTAISQDGKLIGLAFGPLSPENAVERETEILTEVRRQLDEYFRGERRSFCLELSPEGTDFQKKVWRALYDIPYGETRSYRDIALAAGSPKAFRAVGQANHVNPIAIIIPCHRVLRSDGGIGGYAGGLDTKRMLLALERDG